MSSDRWSDDDLRRHILRADSLWLADPDTVSEFRDECARQMTRIAPRLQTRLLEKTGSTTDLSGLAMLAAEAIIPSPDARRWWLVATTTPWSQLEEWVVDDLAKIYKAAAKSRKKDKKALDGIDQASNRRAITD